MKKYILALDQGTTSSRTIVFDKKGNIVSKAQFEFTQIYPKSGWVEHDPYEIWESQLHSLQVALQNGNIKAEEIAAVGITNNIMERVAALVAAKVDCIVIDSAHGHSKNIIDTVRKVKEAYPDLQVIAGNIATGEAAQALIDAGILEDDSPSKIESILNVILKTANQGVNRIFEII